MTSKRLQEKKLDIHAAVSQLKHTTKFLQQCRTDTEFESKLIDAREIAEQLEIPAEFETEPVRVRKRKTLFDYEQSDEPIVNPKDRFKVNFYFAVIDTTIQSVQERFTQVQHISCVFGFLYAIHSLITKTSQQVMEDCSILEKVLQHDDSKDIDAAELCSEC